MDIFKLIGIIGLLAISLGIILKSRRQQDILYILGGLCLEAYSIYLGDWIFMILQAAFIISAVYDVVKHKR